MYVCMHAHFVCQSYSIPMCYMSLLVFNSQSAVQLLVSGLVSVVWSSSERVSQSVYVAQLQKSQGGTENDWFIRKNHSHKQVQYLYMHLYE